MMIDPSLLILTILAIVNASIPFGDTTIAVPVNVEPLGSPTQQVTPAASTGSIDFNGLTGLVTAIGGILGAVGFKMFKDSKRDETRANLIADTSLKQTLSLQETDKADYIFKEALVEYITNPADETKKQKLIQLSQQSKQNYNAYYENIQPQPLDYHKDPVVRKLSAVEKRSEPNTA